MIHITEPNIIKFLIHNDTMKVKVFPHMEESFFLDPNCRDIFRVIEQEHRQTQKFPLAIESLIVDNPWSNKPEQIQEKMKIVKVDEPKQYAKTDSDTLVKRMEEWIRLAMFRQMLETGVVDYQAKKTGTLPAMMKKGNEILSFRVGEQPYIDNSDIERMIAIHTEERPKIACGWEHMNMLLGGGFNKKGLNIVQAGTHMGKSRFLLSLATSFRKVSPSNNILYITLEIPDYQFSIFSDMHMLGLTAPEIVDMIRHRKPEYIRRKGEINEKYGNIYIQEFEASTATPEAMKTTLEKLLARGINISGIMIDYLQIMNSRQAELYQKNVENSIALRSMSQCYRIPGFSAVQPNRSGNESGRKGKMGDMMEVGESKGVPDTSDGYFTLSQTPDQYQQNQQFLHILKNRHSGRIYESLALEVNKDLYKVDVVSSFQTPQGMVDGNIEEKNAGIKIPPMPEGITDIIGGIS